MINNRLNKLVPHPGASFAILLGSYIFFLCLISFLGQWMLPKFSDPQRGLRILYIFQAIFVFILPAIFAAVVSTRLPARLLAIEKMPTLRPSLLTILIMLVSIPAMTLIIKWNNGINLPESMHHLQETMRTLEDNAQDSINTIIGSHSVSNLIMSVLIIGVLAGFSEELFFRGAMQRILSNTSLGAHGAIWLTAIIFSAIHLQFFGFFPRMLLGLFFGYLLYWSNSLWLPIIAHIFNNSLACIIAWCQSKTVDKAEILSDGPSILYTIFSILITAFAIWILRRTFRSESAEISQKSA